MYSFRALEIEWLCPIFKLLGQEWGSAYKTDTAAPQLLEEFDPRGIGECDVRQFERQLNFLG